MHWTYCEGRDPERPAWIALHGSGRDERDVAPWVSRIDPGAGVAALRGDVPWESGFAFFARNPDRTLDHAEIEHRAERLESFLSAEILARLGARRPRLFGFSNGAIMGVALLLRGRIRFEAAVLFRPMLPEILEPAAAPEACPALLLDGAQDDRRRPADGRMAARTLRVSGFLVEHQIADCGHAPADEELCAANAWLQRCGLPER